MVVILHDGQVHEVPAGSGTDGHLWVPAADVARVCGWDWQGDRLCRGAETLILSPGQAEAVVRGGQVDLAACWRLLDRPIQHTATGDVWALGTPAAERAAALQTLQAPDFTLPDLDGRPHALADYRGRKVYLVSWASW